jgi:phosphoribosylglycinamide formyltransferase-1
MLRLAILISGRGSNMIKLAEAIDQSHLNAQIAVVISDQHCDGITHAATLGLPTNVIKRQNFATRRAHDAAIEKAINAAAADFVFLAGYMAILGADFTTVFAGRLINIHPSLLPDFKGRDTHQRAIDARATRHGATVHLVTAELDDGPIILQAELSVSPHDNADKLAARVLQLEHQLYPFVLKSLCDGQLTLAADKVTWHHLTLNAQTTPPSAADFAKALRWPVASVT